MTLCKKLLAAALILAGNLSSQAAVGRVSFLKQEGNAVVLKGGSEIIRISVLTPDIVRVQATTNADFKTPLMVQSGFVKTDWPACKSDVQGSEGDLSISTCALKIKVSKAPFELEIFSSNGVSLFKTAKTTGLEIAKGTALNLELTPADHFFGFGYMRKCFDARGNTLTWTRSYRNNEATVPFFMNPRGYAFFSNNTWKNDFDFTRPDFFSVKTEAGDLDFFVMVGADFRRLLALYTDLTGKPQMAPKWALGLEHRCRTYDNDQALLESARLFRKYNIPCELMALEPGWEEVIYAMKYVWSTNRFPDYLGTIQELKKMGYKFDLWESGKAPKEDLLNPKVRQAWFAQRAAALTNWGVDMFKQDDPYPRSISSQGMETAVNSEGQITDNKYQPGEILSVANTFYSQTAFEEWRKLTGHRPVIQFHAYNASVASQRWPYQWGGDFGTGCGLLNASLSGHSMSNGDARSPYLDARHMDFFMSAGPVNDCWAYWIEPWNYSDRLIEACRMYASLRVRLYPYLYTAMREAHETGAPIMRPMVLADPQDPATYKIVSQFFIGDSLLVATSVALDQYGDAARKKIQDEIPAYAERSTPVYFPKGTWTDYWTGKEYIVASNRWEDCTFPSYAGGPLFVKAGGIIPTAQVKHYTEQSPDEIITLDVYPGAVSTSHRLYEDDGITFGYENGRFANTTFSSARKDNAITIDLGKREGDYDYDGKPARRDYLLKVHSLLAPAKVVVDGKELKPATKVKVLFSAKSSGWYYDATASKIIIKPHGGWSFVASGKNPAATYPLSPSEEVVRFAQKTDHSAAASRIEIALNADSKARVGVPTQIVLDPDNTCVLADGRSNVKIGVTICDENGNVVENVNQTVKLALKGGGGMAKSVDIKRGGGEIIFTAPAQAGESQVRVAGAGLSSQPLKLRAAKGRLELVVNPKTKVPNPGKGEWLATQFTIAVSARDAAGHRLATKEQVHLVIRDYKNREVIERVTAMSNGEAEFRSVSYKTRPEKFIITATAEGLEPATFKAFENAWDFPDDYLTNKSIKGGLDDLLLK